MKFQRVEEEVSQDKTARLTKKTFKNTTVGVGANANVVRCDGTSTSKCGTEEISGIDEAAEFSAGPGQGQGCGAL